jgi:phage-related tail protein
MLPVEKILKDIHTSFAKNKLGTAEQGEYLKVIFGEEAMKGAIKLVAAAGDGSLASKREQIAGSKGTTERIAKIQTDNLDGDLKNLQSAWEDSQIEVFEKEDSALRRLTVSATDLLGKVAAWTKANPELTKTLFNVVTGALALIGVLGGIGLIAWPVIAGINGIIAAAGLLSVVFSTAGTAIVAAVGAISLPVVAVAGAVVAGVLLIRKYWEQLGAFFSGVVEGLKAAFAPVAEMFAPLALYPDGTAPQCAQPESLSRHGFKAGLSPEGDAARGRKLLLAHLIILFAPKPHKKKVRLHLQCEEATLG